MDNISFDQKRTSIAEPGAVVLMTSYSQSQVTQGVRRRQPRIVVAARYVIAGSKRGPAGMCAAGSGSPTA
jgi:hypothetical protein